METYRLNKGDIMEQSRFRSKVFWLSVVAQIVALVVLFVPEFNAEVVGKVVAVLAELLVMFGVLNNPTSKSHF